MHEVISPRLEVRYGALELVKTAPLLVVDIANAAWEQPRIRATEYTGLGRILARNRSFDGSWVRYPDFGLSMCSLTLPGCLREEGTSRARVSGPTLQRCLQVVSCDSFGWVPTPQVYET